MYSQIKLYHPGSLRCWTSRYGGVVTFTLPSATMLTVAAGALFPQPLAVAAAVCGATVGACGCFLVARSAFAPAVREVFHLDRVRGSALSSQTAKRVSAHATYFRQQSSAIKPLSQVGLSLHYVLMHSFVKVLYNK